MLRLTIQSFSYARPLNLLPYIIGPKRPLALSAVHMTAFTERFSFGASSDVSLRALCGRTSGF